MTTTVVNPSKLMVLGLQQLCDSVLPAIAAERKQSTKRRFTDIWNQSSRTRCRGLVNFWAGFTTSWTLLFGLFYLLLGVDCQP